MKNNIYIGNFKKSINTELFKIIFLMIIFISFYSVLSCGFDMKYIDKAFYCITGDYEIILLLLVILLNTFNIYKITNSNVSYILRLRKKKKYLIEIIKNIVVSDSIVYIVYIISCVIFLNLFSQKINIEILENYHVPNIVYLFFLTIRNYIILMIISVFSFLSMKLFKKELLVICVDFILLGALLIMPIYIGNIDSVLKMRFFIGFYLKITNYGNFGLEIIITMIYIILSIIIIDLLIKIIYKHVKKVGS